VPSAYAPAVGGVEELTQRLAHHLIDTGHTVEVWTIRHPSELPAISRIQDVTVRRFALPLPAAEIRKALKVLYVEHTSLISGAEGALLDLLEALPSTVVPTLTCPPGPLAEVVRAMGVDVVEFSGVSGGLRLHPRHTLRTVRQILSSARVLRRTVAATEADIVHANSLRAGLIAGCAWTFDGPPTVVHIHDALPPTRTAWLVRAAIRLAADAVITISEYTTENFAGGRSRHRIHTLHNPLNTARFDPVAQTRQDARIQLGLGANDKLIGLVAQITQWKGHEVAIRSLNREISTGG
jgi:glycosyltransferase involved in cell wall biosynthesis